MTDTTKNILHSAIEFVLFPVLVVGVVPVTLAQVYGFDAPHPTDVGYWFAKVLLPGGFVLMAWTAILLVLYGQGSSAPWRPTRKLVVEGPFKFVRNPMTVGALMMMLGEALITSSRPMALWLAAVFVALNAYIFLIEEPGLKKRFGEDYQTYKQNVGRWIPRLSGWSHPRDEQPASGS